MANDEKKIEKLDLDRTGKKVSEGYYAIDLHGRLVLMPPTSGLRDGYRLATQADIDKGPARYAQLEDIPVEILTEKQVGEMGEIAK